MKQPKRRQVMRSIDKQYILNVKTKLPKGKNRETLLENLRESVHTYYEEHLSADLDELYKRFGTPDEIAESFSDASSPSSILTAKDLPKRILLITAAALAAICIITIVKKTREKILQASLIAMMSTQVHHYPLTYRILTTILFLMPSSKIRPAPSEIMKSITYIMSETS